MHIWTESNKQNYEPLASTWMRTIKEKQKIVPPSSSIISILNIKQYFGPHSSSLRRVLKQKTNFEASLISIRPWQLDFMFCVTSRVTLGNSTKQNTRTPACNFRCSKQKTRNKKLLFPPPTNKLPKQKQIPASWHSHLLNLKNNISQKSIHTQCYSVQIHKTQTFFMKYSSSKIASVVSVHV